MASALLSCSQNLSLLRAIPSSRSAATCCVSKKSAGSSGNTTGSKLQCRTRLPKEFMGGSWHRTSPRRNAIVAMALPEIVGGNEEYIEILEAAYADQELANELQERMRTDRLFSMQMKVAMQQDDYRDRITAAIEASPFLKAAIDTSPQVKGFQDQIDSSPLLKPLQDEKVMSQLETLQSDPRKMAMMMKQSEGKLKEAAGDLVLGVKEYYEDFQPDADELLAKFQEIAKKGYPAFMKIAVADVRVQNAIINALMDDMEEEQKNREQESP